MMPYTIVNIGSGNSVLPVWYQAFTKTSVCLQSINLLQTNFCKFERKYTFRYRPIWLHFCLKGWMQYEYSAVHYNVAQYNMILHTVQQWLNQNTYQNNHSQKRHITLTLTGELWAVWYKTKFFSQNLATKFGNHLCMATKIGRRY